MKTKVLVLLACLSILTAAYSQVPQGVNYQALALDGSNEPIRNATINVRLMILSSLSPEVIEWHELHSNVPTSNSGLFTLVLGQGVKQGTPVASTFSLVNWTNPEMFIRTYVTHLSVEHNMGTSRILSVPYALSAGAVSGSLPRLQVEGLPSVTDDALFEVKNKDGQTVFAVYNQGVRMYVGPGESKAVKGGFAIGSFDESKLSQDLLVVNPDCVRVYLDDNPLKAVKGGFAIGSFDESKSTQDLFKVSTDSIRMYIDNTPGKAVKGGFAIGSFDESKAAGESFFDILPVSTSIINPSEPRILWYPLKNAFLAGQVLITDPALVGTNSMSIGYETRAEGEYSQALGYMSQAVGTGSTAIGRHSQAGGANSFALGDSAIVGNDDAYAIGAGARATGRGAFAIGSKDRLFGDNFSLSTSATGDLSMAMGLNAKAVGAESFASGISVSATGQYSVAMGRSASAEGLSSLAIEGTASGDAAIAIRGNASGYSSIAIGLGNASAWQSTAIAGGEATGANSIAMGGIANASGDYATAIGAGTNAQSYGSFVVGYYNVTEGSKTSVVATDPLFVVGNGTYISPKNAFTVLKNGRTAIGHNSPTQMLDVDGQVRIRGGSPAAGKILTSAADGTATWESPVTAAHTHSASEITAGTLGVARGGTGLSSVTSGKIMVGNGTSALLTPANLHWDNTNSRLGLGTSTPGTRLQVNGNLAVGTYSAAPANGIAVSGNVGIGTTAPADNLHLANSSGGVKIRMEASSSNSSMEFRTGTTYLGAFGANHTDGYLFIYQGTNFSFRNGNMGIGNTDPAQKLDITGGNGRVQTGYQWLTNSDIRYKSNVTTLNDALGNVMNMRGVRFDLLEDAASVAGSGKHIGFIAQELEEVYPEFVVTGSDGYKSVAYDKVTAVLVEAVKEQQSQIETYKSEVSALRTELEMLRSEMAAVKQLVSGQMK